MTKAELACRINALIDELIPVGTEETARVASILLAIQFALRDGNLATLSQAIWDSSQGRGDWLEDRTPAGPGAGEAMSSPLRGEDGRPPVRLSDLQFKLLLIYCEQEELQRQLRRRRQQIRRQRRQLGLVRDFLRHQHDSHGAAAPLEIALVGRERP
jgi:hypothetical protein